MPVEGLLNQPRVFIVVRFPFAKRSLTKEAKISKILEYKIIYIIYNKI